MTYPWREHLDLINEDPDSWTYRGADDGYHVWTSTEGGVFKTDHYPSHRVARLGLQGPWIWAELLPPIVGTILSRELWPVVGASYETPDGLIPIDDLDALAEYLVEGLTISVEDTGDSVTVSIYDGAELISYAIDASESVAKCKAALTT